MDKDDPTSHAEDGRTEDRRTEDRRGESGIRDAVNQIWLAGLGAFARAQEEGGKLFESLVREGAAMQGRTRSSASEKMAEAGHRMADLAEDLTQRASGQWDRVGSRVEQGMAQTLDRMGLASAREVAALQARIEALERTVELLTERELRAQQPPPT